jgi:membrane protein DedA with SNARE-associated domain
MEPLFRLLAHYGYAGLFVVMVLGIVGVPIPAETLLVVAGALAARGKLLLTLAAASGLSGTVAGISISYLLGTSAASPLIHRYGRYLHITPEYLERMHAWFASKGEWLLTFGYFIPGVRHFTALVAGMSGLEYRKFALFAYSGAVLWVGVFFGLGYFLGDRWEGTIDFIHHYTWLAIGIAAVAFGIAYLVRRRIRKSMNSKRVNDA